MLKKQLAVVLTLAGMVVVMAAPAPVYHWDFEPSGFKTVNGRSVAPGGGGRTLPASFVVEGGYGGGSALQCQPGEHRRQVVRMKMEWPAFTLELRFRTDVEFKASAKPTSLVYYMGHSWSRRFLDLYVTPEGRLGVEIKVKTDDGKTQLKNFRLEGEPHDFRPDVWYTVRLAAQAGGKCQLWVDGVLYQEAAGALALADLAGKYPEAYPLMILGGAFPGDKNERQFTGLIDDVRLWDQVVDPTGDTAIPAAAASGISISDPNLVLKTAANGPKLDGNLDEPVWNEAEWTAPFTVLDKAAAALGAFEKVEDKFVTHAAKAAVATDGQTLFLAVKCPVPPGVEYKLTATKDNDNIWSDDCIEFFLRPDISQPLFFQYLVNADGWKQVLRHRDVGLTDMNIASQAQARSLRTSTQFSIELAIPLAELGLSDLKASPGITFNVTRCGPTAGGLSTWAPVGQVFANPPRFGKLLPAGRAAFLAQQFAEVEADLVGMAVAPTLKAEAAPRFVAFKEQLEQRGDDPASWDSLNAGLQNLRNSLTKIALAGKPFLLWSGKPWANTPTNLPVPMTAKALETVRLRMARNGKVVYGFAFSNLTDRAMLPRIKLIPDPLPEKPIRYNCAPAADTDAGLLAPHVTFKEGLPMQDQSAQTIPDPLTPLILNALFRCQPGCTVPLWMEIDTRGLTTGVYRALVQVRPTCCQAEPQHFRLELEIVDLDLGEMEVDTFNYCYVKNRAAYKVFRDYGFTYLYCGTPGQRNLDIYPQFDQDGNVIKGADFTHLDQQIDEALAAGMNPATLKLFFFLAFDYTYWRSLMHNGKTQLEFGTPAWQKGFTAWVAQLKAHLQDKYQISLDRVVFNPEDESDGNPDDPKSTMHLALAAVKAIKQADPQVRTMLNPHFGAKLTGDPSELLRRLAEHTDIIEFYRPHLERKPELAALARKAGDFEFWIYHILSKGSAPLTYRRLYWQNWVDDFTAVCAYWHFDSHAGYDGFNSFDGSKNTADYGVIYSDEASDQIITSRRCEAWFQGAIDFKLARLCERYLAQAQAKGQNVAAEAEKLKEVQQRGLQADIDGLAALQQELIDLALVLKRKAQ